MAETYRQFWLRRGRELNKISKAALCIRFRALGYIGGLHPPETWRKDEVINEILDCEWRQLPDDQKLPDPPPAPEPPCSSCGSTEGLRDPRHQAGGDHHYSYTMEAPA